MSLWADNWGGTARSKTTFPARGLTHPPIYSRRESVQMVEGARESERKVRWRVNTEMIDTVVSTRVNHFLNRWTWHTKTTRLSPFFFLTFLWGNLEIQNFIENKRDYFFNFQRDLLKEPGVAAPLLQMFQIRGKIRKMEKSDVSDGPFYWKWHVGTRIKTSEW